MSKNRKGKAKRKGGRTGKKVETAQRAPDLGEGGSGTRRGRGRRREGSKGGRNC